jgi:hypothetical protein
VYVLRNGGLKRYHLSHLNTYLNDRNWMLKCAFFETIVGVATFLGGTSLEEFILPLMVQALTDPEEFVIQEGLATRLLVWHNWASFNGQRLGSLLTLSEGSPCIPTSGSARPRPCSSLLRQCSCQLRTTNVSFSH